MRSAHDATVIRAMPKPESVAQLVDSLFQQALLEQPGILGQAIEFGAQTMRGNQRAGVAQLGFAKNESQDGDEKVDVGHSQDSPAFRRRILQKPPENFRGVVLAAPGVVSKLAAQPVRANPA